jgi:hypothetical protein
MSSWSGLGLSPSIGVPPERRTPVRAAGGESPSKEIGQVDVVGIDLLCKNKARDEANDRPEDAASQCHALG